MRKIETNNPNHPKNIIPKTTGNVQKSIIYMFNYLIKINFRSVFLISFFPSIILPLILKKSNLRPYLLMILITSQRIFNLTSPLSPHYLNDNETEKKKPLVIGHCRSGLGFLSLEGLLKSSSLHELPQDYKTKTLSTTGKRFLSYQALKRFLNFRLGRWLVFH